MRLSSNKVQIYLDLTRVKRAFLALPLSTESNDTDFQLNAFISQLFQTLGFKNIYAFTSAEKVQSAA